MTPDQKVTPDPKNLYTSEYGAVRSKLEHWASYFKTVGSPVRLLIILALYESDFLGRQSHSLTFSDVKSISGLPSDEALAYHLRQLENAGFIRKDAHKDEKNRRVYPLYHIGEQGTRFLEDLGLTQLLQTTMQELQGS